MLIVTGGAGFIGSAMVWRLNQAGLSDIIVVDNLNCSEKWKNLVNRTFTDYVHKSEFLSRLESGQFGHIEALIHLGACSSTTEKDADFLMENNFHYSVRIARYALSNNIRCILASSAATYGDGQNGFSDETDQLIRLKPLNMYGYSKHLFDLWAYRTGALDKLASLKFFNVFGPNEYHKGQMASVVFKAFGQVRQTGKIRLFKSYRSAFGDGEQRRDFVYVKDCVELIFWLMQNPALNGVYNVGTGCDRTWNDLAKAVFSAMDLPVCIEYFDMPEQLKDRYQYLTRASTRKLDQLGHSVVFASLEDSVRDYICNYLQMEDPYL
jgi:ADP-L-glycero-D-manno-heptose 6-epimerase